MLPIRTLFFALLVFSYFASESVAETNVVRYSVVIGNNQGSVDDVELSFAERDAKRLASVLEKLGDVSPENQVILLGNTANEIRRALLEVNARIRKTSSQKETLLIVYYSGHADARGLHPGRTVLPYSELRNYLEGSAAKVRLLFLDGCRSGNVTKVKGGTAVDDVEILATQSSGAEGVIMISSSAAGEDSHESEGIRSSFFSHHLTNGLIGAADENKDNRVSLSEVYAYAYRNTLRESGRSRQLQHPTFSYDLKGRADPSLTKIGGHSSMRVSQLKLTAPGTYIIYENSENGNIAAELNVRQKGALLALPPGKYFIQHRKRSHYTEYSLRLKPKTTSSLSKEQGKRVSYARLVRKGGAPTDYSQQMYARLGAHASVLEGGEVSPSLQLGHQLDFSSLSVGFRLQLAQSRPAQLSEHLEMTVGEMAAGVLLQRVWDLKSISFGLGVNADAVRLSQSFSGESLSPDRSAFAARLGTTLTLELPMTERLFVGSELGASTYILSKAVTSAGKEVEAELESQLTWTGHLGLGVRF